MKKTLLVFLVIGIFFLAGCTSNQELELVAEGTLINFQVNSAGWLITLDSELYFIDGRYIVLYGNPMYLGEYYYLYQDTVGSSAWAIPYRLTQERIEK